MKNDDRSQKTSQISLKFDSVQISVFSAASGRRSDRFDRTGNFMKMALDFMKFHTSVEARSFRQNPLGSCRVFAEMRFSNSGRM
jgi:hypothetical protein